MSTNCCWFFIRQSDKIVHNAIKFCSYYGLPQHLFNCWTLILFDCQQIVNKVSKNLRVTLWQFVSLTIKHCFNSYRNILLRIRFLPCHESVRNDTERPNIIRRMSIFLKDSLLDWSIKWSEQIFKCRQLSTLKFERCSKISYYVKFLATNKLLENIVRLKITMYHIFLVNMV